MSEMKRQTSDAENSKGGKVAGTNTTGLKPRPTSAESIAPSGNSTSGSSQTDSRGRQGMGK